VCVCVFVCVCVCVCVCVSVCVDLLSADAGPRGSQHLLERLVGGGGSTRTVAHLIQDGQQEFVDNLPPARVFKNQTVGFERGEETPERRVPGLSCIGVQGLGFRV
jgi:hypothetical protein